MNDIFVIKRDRGGTPIATELPCGHIFWGNPPKDCPTCAQIKAAEDKRGEEVLELAELKMRSPVTFRSEQQWKRFITAYHKRFKG